MNKEIQIANIQKIITHLLEAPNNSFGELSLLCDLHGSDKGSYYNAANKQVHGYPWLPHTYTDIYEILFKNLKYEKLNLFECGIGTNNTKVASNMTDSGHPGASLRTWRDYFVNANIYGADIDTSCLFEEDRIKTGWIDQLDPKAIRKYFRTFKVPFDIMIDDGLHTTQAAMTLFEHASKFLRKGGIYVIEDLNINQIYELQRYLVKKEDFTIQYAIMYSMQQYDNNLVICRKIAP